MTAALIYLALMAFLPLLYSTAKSMSREKLGDRIFLKTVAKDYLRTFPTLGLVALPLVLFPSAAKAYLIVLHLVFAWMLFGDLWHVHLFGARAGINTWYSMFVTTRGEIAEYIRNNMTLGQWLLIGLVYLAPVAAIALWLPPLALGPARWPLAAGCALLAVPLVRNCFKTGARHKPAYMLNPFVSVFYHYFLYTRRYRVLLKQIAAHAAPPFAGIVSKLPPGTPQTYVICIGESANRQHHGYAGYARDTNAFTRARGDVIGFTGVRSQYAQTLPSLEKTITFATDAAPELLYKKGSIVDYFKDAGFKTFWLSNQYALGEEGDTAITAMAGHADESKCFNFSAMKGFESASSGLDGTLIPELEKRLDDPAEKKVIFLHMIGSHSAYVNRYPAAFRHFTDDPPGKAHLSAAAKAILNTYDDSIRYTDWVIAEFVKRLAARGRTAAEFLLYFSDHGEDCFDTTDDKILGHGPVANEPMTSVPLQIWVSDRLKELRPDLVARLARPKPSYRLEDLIHLAIDLASLENPDFQPEKSLLGGAA
ncbi:MAG: phosphoethanolamine transferase [Kiritimatiellae bacterium]|nr:phosphoethanolamine transferase [Kiritimatiellia bacterium]